MWEKSPKIFIRQEPKMLREAISKEEQNLEKSGDALTFPQYGLKAARRAPQFSKR